MPSLPTWAALLPGVLLPTLLAHKPLVRREGTGLLEASIRPSGDVELRRRPSQFQRWSQLHKTKRRRLREHERKQAQLAAQRSGGAAAVAPGSLSAMGAAVVEVSSAGTSRRSSAEARLRDIEECSWADWADWGDCFCPDASTPFQMRTRHRKMGLQSGAFSLKCSSYLAESEVCTEPEVSCPNAAAAQIVAPVPAPQPVAVQVVQQPVPLPAVVAASGQQIAPDEKYSISQWIPANDQGQPFRSSMGQSVCSVGQPVLCGGYGAAAGSPSCAGNECCAGTAGSSLTVVCPSAEPGWNGCDEPKRHDCLGGMYGERVKASASVSSQVEPMPAPKQEEVSDDANEALWGVCWPALCPKGFRLRADLPEDLTCEEVKCTSHDCCTQEPNSHTAAAEAASTAANRAARRETSSTETTTMQVVGEVLHMSTVAPLSREQLEAKLTTTTTAYVPTTAAGTTTTSHTLSMVANIMKNMEDQSAAPAQATTQSGMSTGVIVLIVAGAILFLAASCAVGYLVEQSMRKKDDDQPELAEAGPATPEARASLRSGDRL